ncbi:DUF4352 domain-containing protein [Mycobacterium sp. IDR2000157661]|uniref:DUF4352 domain-containing protein n=1 Tax=Mycobacterium sp. IDR2000157661 TaxID=2867005 RepID=UPI001EEA51B5|nr:DUF4352 domain-containing protein [Mycobacterium sp. IDR2000157661]ULE33974.1 DUF4352 domain-containing protein [Mycobacterium sp. IDR2000157661]
MRLPPRSASTSRPSGNRCATATSRSSSPAWIYLGNTLADLNPGGTINTAVVFDVPDGTRPESIELHDGKYSDGVTVDLE